jgi:hypothetical protein
MVVRSNTAPVAHTVKVNTNYFACNLLWFFQYIKATDEASTLMFPQVCATRRPPATLPAHIRTRLQHSFCKNKKLSGIL